MAGTGYTYPDGKRYMRYPGRYEETAAQRGPALFWGFGEKYPGDHSVKPDAGGNRGGQRIAVFPARIF